MNRSLHLIVLVCTSVCAAGAAAQTSDATTAKGRPVFGRLAPDELRIIQGLGHAVLAAHQRETADPVEEALRNDMRDLGEALDQSLLTTTPRIQIDRGATARPDSESDADRRRQQISSRDERYAAVRSRLAGVRQRTDRLRATPTSRDSAQNAHSSDLLSRAGALHAEIGAALDGPAAETGPRLAKLRERLRPKTLREVLAERETAAREAGEPIPEPTPTISTLVRHR